MFLILNRSPLIFGLERPQPIWCTSRPWAWHPWRPSWPRPRPGTQQSQSRPPGAHPGRGAWLSGSPGHRCPRGSCHTGPRKGYTPAMRSPCCQRSLVSRTPMSKRWTTSPGSTWPRDWHIQCVMQNSVLRPRCTGWWVVESAGKMLLRRIYEGLRESNMARTPCSIKSI